MFALNITVDVPAGIKDATQGFDAMLQELGSTMHAQTMENFDGSHDPGGAPWAPTKRGGQILVDTGALRGSIDFIVGSDSVEVGSNVFYGAFHQSGTSKMVARPFIGIGDADWQELQAIAQRHLAAMFGAAA